MASSDSLPPQHEPTRSGDPDADVSPASDGSAGRNRPQWKLLVVAILGLVFAVTYAWTIRARWMRLVDPLYGDPIYEAFRRYDLQQAIVPRELFAVGNTQKEGIPSLDEPKFVTAKNAGSMRPTDRVIGITMGGQSRAYPLKILNYHELVNDRIAGQAIAVTYCPLCDSVLVFDRSSPTGPIEFGVSGLLFNSNVVFYNRAPGDAESLWSQMKAQAIYGPKARQRLVPLPHEITTWASWTNRHPATLVLSSETGLGRDYNRPSPYVDYFAGKVPLPVFTVAPYPPVDRLEWLDRVLGVWNKNGRAARAFPVKSFQDFEETTEIDTEVGGAKLTLAYDPGAKSLRVVRADEGVQWMYSFWFAWHAFHPETDLYGLPAKTTGHGKPVTTNRGTPSKK